MAYLLIALSVEDVSLRALEIAKRRLNWDKLTEKQRARINLLHGSLIYRDQHLAGFNVATVVEVIEHLDFLRLDAFECVLLEFSRHAKIITTTPNAEFNVKFEHLPVGQFRYHDHRFEWTRAQFESWTTARAVKYGYGVSIRHVGELLLDVGAPAIQHLRIWKGCVSADCQRNGVWRSGGQSVWSVARLTLRRVHECVFGVLALESEPVDPRL